MIENYKHIHFIGIGGAGMSALAYVLVQRGFVVTGSDLQPGHMSDALVAAGARIHYGHHAAHVEGADAVVVSTAIHPDNPELIAAKIAGKQILHRSDVLADLLNAQGAEGLAVAGAHGKSTTSAMLAVITHEAGCDPTVVIGGEVASLGGNSRNGASPMVVAEADESDESFLKFHPYVAVVTNIENDHLDHYGTEERIYEAFRQFVGQLKPGGQAVLCFDSPKVRRLAAEMQAPCISYGFDQDCDYMATNVLYSVEGTRYELYYHGELVARVRLQVPGRHNVLNSMGAFAAARAMNVPVPAILEALAGFTGVKRRFETKSKVHGVWVVDDYAHHPTEIAVTLRAARQTGAKRVVCVFQPHRYTRTHILHDQFCTCFADADELVLTHVYSAGETPIPGVDGESLARDVKAATGQHTLYIAEFDRVVRYLAENAQPGDLIMTVGAGDVYKIGEALVNVLQDQGAGDSVKAPRTL